MVALVGKQFILVNDFTEEHLSSFLFGNNNTYHLVAYRESLIAILFIITDTEGSFMVERVYQIAEGCISDILEHFPHSHEKSSSGHKQLQPEHFLADIYYFRICSYTEQIAAISYLEKFLGEHKDVSEQLTFPV